MTLRSKRSQVALLVLTLALAAGLAMPGIAMAYVIGDAHETAEVTGVPFSDANSLIAIPAPYNDFEYWYEVPLTAGQTIEVTSTATAANAYTWAWSAGVHDPYEVFSWPVSPGVQRLRFMAPRTGSYFIAVLGATAGDFTVGATTIPTMPFALKSMVAKKRVKARRTFKVSASVAPGYNSGASPIRFYLQRRANGKWKAYGTSKAGKLSVAASGYSKYYASYKLPKGTFRVHAGFRDVAHPAVKYNSYKTFKVR